MNTIIKNNSHYRDCAAITDNLSRIKNKKGVMPILPAGKIQGIFKLKKRIGRSLEFFRTSRKNRDDLSFSTPAALVPILTLAAVLSTGMISESWADNTPTIIESGSCGPNCLYTIDSDNNFVATALKSGDEGYVDGSKAVISTQFQNRNLSTVTLSQGINKIDAFVFKNNAITSFNIPDSLSFIGQHAFYDNRLTKVDIPPTLTSLGWGAFEQNRITSVTIPNHFTSTSNAFVGNPFTSLTIPDTIKVIDNWAFGNNKQLTEITIPDSVISIGDAAFANDALQKVTLGDSVKTIGIMAFSGNDHLKQIVIPDTVTQIGKAALGGASAVNNLQIICKGSNESCTNLKNLLANYTTDGENRIDLSGKMEIVGDIMCDSTNYYWDGIKCIRQPDVRKRKCCADVCKDMGGFCNRIRYTPAEAAAILNDDDNEIIITFKK